MCKGPERKCDALREIQGEQHVKECVVRRIDYEAPKQTRAGL